MQVGKTSLLVFNVVLKRVLNLNVGSSNGGSSNGRQRYTGSVRLYLFAALGRQGEVQRSRDDQAHDGDERGDVRDGEGVDLKRVVTLRVEERIGEADDDSEDGRRDVFDHGGPEDRDTPVLALRDDEIEIACQLIALYMWY